MLFFLREKSNYLVPQDYCFHYMYVIEEGKCNSLLPKCKRLSLFSFFRALKINDTFRFKYTSLSSLFSTPLYQMTRKGFDSEKEGAAAWVGNDVERYVIS